MYASLAEIILNNESNDYRFESFARELCEKHEGLTFVPTSQSWDLGRDARATASGRGTHRNIICATLNRNLEVKVNTDLIRATANASPDRIVYCSSQKLSESKTEEITTIIKRHTAQGSILVLGSLQLSTLAEKYHETFEKFYHAEIQDIRDTILSAKDSNVNTKGLRLALIAFGSTEGISLRKEVLQVTLLGFMEENKSYSLPSIAQGFSADIGLQKTLSENFLRDALETLQTNGEVEYKQGGWRLTAKGCDRKNGMPLEAATHLIEGRQLIREQLEKLIGLKLDDKQYGQIWASLMDCISGIFHANGLDVMIAVEQILTGIDEDGSTDVPDLRALLTEGVKRAASIIQTDDLRDAVGCGLLDIFTERDSKAFDWLTKVAERFVVLCSLGLEDSSSEAAREVLSSHRVILDSDVILDYLCEGESEHGAAHNLLSEWLMIGGRLLVSTVVLEEVAHHAWISERDYNESELLIGKLRPEEMRRYIKSAFVRTFYLRNIRREHWPMYIGQFRGNAPGDYTKILRSLRTSLKVEVLPEAYDDTLRQGIVDYLLESSHADEKEAEQSEDINYKVERDGKLLASIAAASRSQEMAGVEGPLVLLSSSRQLRMAELKFKAEFGNQRVVLSKRALGYLLATTPKVGLGADTLRRALFDFGSHARLTDSERRALRLLRATELYDLPWANRVTLQQTLSNVMTTEAEKRGMPVGRLRSELYAGKEPDTSARLIVASIERLAVPNKTALELKEAIRKNEELEAAIAKLEKDARTTSKKK